MRIENRFLTLENLEIVRSAFPALGTLSIDVNGNDYWFLKSLIDIKLAIICVEYSRSFSQHSVTVMFDRDKKFFGMVSRRIADCVSSFGLGARIRFGGGFTRWRQRLLHSRWNA